mmetsp:Transcript_16169/g.31269  ORF Transcript_16169/g.31269 Transcript_16169/m.31269 type:complete len:297 (+) Transcript_16169:69-959(+)|eukprot:CAMPEP_0171487952 /NCGR_PEP_ID=MMETSP0958-20121227/1937_1 /TAXON_ID=87120 /ORGANISM="Aurantiochytrium limacinum, Strain ATCCMYA-1381" /LENGTH=296 /DNA_ID=CAMNT_0012021011 /DNA_START=63 /DNA_END=953 /DNA_ORIENTATION=-
MKFTQVLIFVLGFVTLANVKAEKASLSDDAKLAENPKQRRNLKVKLTAAQKRPNHPVCSEIAGENGWWESRQNLTIDYATIDEQTTVLDTYCFNYSDDPEACRSKSARGNYTDLSTDALNAACTMLGSSNRTCVGNPCNQYNTGECTLQETAGRCVWLTSEDVSLANKYFGEKIYAGHGCYKNRCHAQAVGKGKITDELCESFSIPPIFNCTYCKSTKSYDIAGTRMGCQMTQLTTEAVCAPVSPNAVSSSSIWQTAEDPRCQCSDEYPLCAQAVAPESSTDSRAPGKYVRKYKTL